MAKRWHDEPDEPDLLEQMEQAGLPPATPACQDGRCERCPAHSIEDCACPCHEEDGWL